ncbi:hypothetical protein A6R68_20578, partial [Neotoma lepida]
MKGLDGGEQGWDVGVWILKRKNRDMLPVWQEQAQPPFYTLGSELKSDEAPNVDIGQGLCKQARPERLNTDTSYFNEGIDLNLRDRHLVVVVVIVVVVVQDKGGADADKLGVGGHGADCRQGASPRMKRGPHPNTVLASSGEPSTL